MRQFPSSVRGYSWYVVILVCAIYVLSYLDRLILGLLVQPIQSEISINDTEMSLLFGMAFASVFALAGLPLGRMADTRNRKLLIIAGILLWCALTIASGFAQNFPTLLACRFGVAIGEAAFLPAALSIISDLFPRDRRSLPISIVMTAGMLGVSASYFLGAAIIDLVVSLNESGILNAKLAAWRLTLIAVGLPGIIFALIFAVTVSEPERTFIAEQKISLVNTWKHMVESGWAYFGMLGGTALLTLIPFSLSAWFPTFLIRHFGMSAQEAGYSFGAAFAIGAISGSLILPSIANWLSVRGRGDAIPTVAALALFVGAPLAILAPLAPNSTTSVLLVGAALFLLAGAPTLASVSVQVIAPQRARAQLQSVYLLLTNTIGLGFGPTITVLLSEWFFNGPEDIGLGISSLAALAAPMAIVVLLMARADFSYRFHKSATEIGM